LSIHSLTGLAIPPGHRTGLIDFFVLTVMETAMSFVVARSNKLLPEGSAQKHVRKKTQRFSCNAIYTPSKLHL
jgi:hypothetical protein